MTQHERYELISRAMRHGSFSKFCTSPCWLCSLYFACRRLIVSHIFHVSVRSQSIGTLCTSAMSFFSSAFLNLCNMLPGAGSSVGLTPSSRRLYSTIRLSLCRQRIIYGLRSLDYFARGTIQDSNYSGVCKRNSGLSTAEVRNMLAIATISSAVDLQ